MSNARLRDKSPPSSTKAGFIQGLTGCHFKESSMDYPCGDCQGLGCQNCGMSGISPFPSPEHDTPEEYQCHCGLWHPVKEQRRMIHRKLLSFGTQLPFFFSLQHEQDSSSFAGVYHADDPSSLVLSEVPSVASTHPRQYFAPGAEDHQPCQGTRVQHRQKVSVPHWNRT